MQPVKHHSPVTFLLKSAFIVSLCLLPAIYLVGDIEIISRFEALLEALPQIF